MKHILIIAIAIASTVVGYSQQLQTSSFYDLQGILHNPATAGIYKHNYIGATYRTQWAGISGRPKTMNVFGSFTMPKHNMGLAGYAYNDVTGPTSRTGVQLSIAKHIPLADGGTLSVGIENRIQQYALNKNKLYGALGNDPVLAGKENAFKYDAGAGIAYKGKKLTIGAAVSQLVQSKLDFYTGNLNPNEEGRLYRHFYAHTSYEIDVDGQTKIIPNLMAIYLPNAPLDMQGNIRIEHNNTFWYGIGARYRQSFNLSAGVRVQDKWLIGYAFDIYKTPLSIFDGGSAGHEFVLRYELD
jgi:type IX secretion system PorP/SprF family membrane protein